MSTSLKVTLAVALVAALGIGIGARMLYNKDQGTPKKHVTQQQTSSKKPVKVPSSKAPVVRANTSSKKAAVKSAPAKKPATAKSSVPAAPAPAPATK
jgi:hypothetical protein